MSERDSYIQQLEEENEQLRHKLSKQELTEEVKVAEPDDLGVWMKYNLDMSMTMKHRKPSVMTENPEYFYMVNMCPHCRTMSSVIDNPFNDKECAVCGERHGLTSEEFTNRYEFRAKWVEHDYVKTEMVRGRNMFLMKTLKEVNVPYKVCFWLVEEHDEE